MTKREAAIVAAYTGILIGDFDEMHKYIEQIMDRPVWTHEMGSQTFSEAIKERSRADFIGIIVED